MKSADRSGLDNEEKEKSFMLNRLIDELPGGVAVIRVADRLECQYFNDGFAALSNRTRAELEEALKNPHFLENLVYKLDSGNVKQTIISKTNKGESININYRFMTKDGDIKWMHMSASKLRDENGYPVYYCVFFAPSGETALYMSVVEDSASGIAVIDRGTQCVVYANSAMKLYYNCSSDKEMIGKKVIDIIADKSALMSDEERNNLPYDHYIQFHKLFNGKKYASIRARALTWNGVDSYIVYIADETVEYNRNRQQRDLLDKVPSGVGIYEIKNGITKQLYMNDYYYKMIGVEREQRKKEADTDFLKLVNPEDMPAVHELIAGFCDGNDIGYLNHRIICGDGTYRWFRLVGNVIERKGEKLTVYCNYIDFEETMNAQKNLEKANISIRMEYEKEQQKRNFLEKSSIVDITLNISRDHVIEIKRRGKSVILDSGTMSCREYIKSLQQRIPNEIDRKMLGDCFDRDQNISSFRNGIDERHEEFRYRFQNGLLHWLRADSSMSVDPDTGDIIAYVFVKDIDEDKKKQIVANSVIDKDMDYVVIVSTVDDMAKLIRINENYGIDSFINYEKFKFSLFLENKNIGNVFIEDQDKVKGFFNLDELKAAIEKKQIANVLFRKKREDGSICRKRLHAYYLDPEHEDIVIVCRDITDFYEEEMKQKHMLQRALDEANNANRAKSEFLSNMSHDIRTPLNAVLGFADLARDTSGLPADVSNYLDKISTSGKYLLGLINDILDMSKMENGKMKLYEENTDAIEFLDSVASIFISQAEVKGIRLKTDFSGVTDRWVMMDQLRSRQIYSNLLSNAIKFSKSGTEICWTVTDTPTGDDTYHMVSTISDHGCGMSREFMNRMFRPFEQNDPSNEATGTGLGLSIVKNLVTLMGGTVRAESRQGLGSTFIVELDRKAGSAKQNLSIEEGVQDRLRGMHILMCEDNSVNTMVAVKILEKLGCIVDCAENGEAGVEKFKSSAPYEYDIILMDIRMPVMDGFEATQKILSLDRADAATVPIVAMSANAFDEDLIRGREAGMKTYITKPIDTRKLCSVLAEQARVHTNVNRKE